ncbi:MAG: hypothetical protein FWD91_07230 [Treponema sp.]|nr:hypothetical protein [Treponema sp.]
MIGKLKAILAEKKLTQLPAKLAQTMKGFAQTRKAVVQSAHSSAAGHLSRLPKKAVFCAGTGALLLITLAVIFATSSRPPTTSVAATVANAAFVIPPEDFFIPGEPDFVPHFILDREPRQFWSVEDIRPYWRIPSNPEFWQGVLRSTVDEIMERVQ